MEMMQEHRIKKLFFVFDFYYFLLHHRNLTPIIFIDYTVNFYIIL